MYEKTVDVIEVCEVGVYFKYPVRLHQDQSSEEEHARSTSHERPVLHPCDEVVKAP
jgi:hypothetical protein